jgi:hypothetical protein
MNEKSSRDSGGPERCAAGGPARQMCHDKIDGRSIVGFDQARIDSALGLLVN